MVKSHKRHEQRIALSLLYSDSQDEIYPPYASLIFRLCKAIRHRSGQAHISRAANNELR